MKIIKLSDIDSSEILTRCNESVDVSASVGEIIANVKQYGDKALYDYTAKFDKANLTALEVTPEELNEAFASVDDNFKRILATAADNIRAFHEKQIRNSFIITQENGILAGQRIVPIEKVGLYVPGGTAAYPSTVLMDSIPAKIAGCKQIVMVTPPLASGKISPAILAAAKIAGVDKIYKVGGAQAIAALAYGTESIPKVDKIVGPGNAYVAEAKRQVYGEVSIDMIAGPSDILVIADKTANYEFVAADLLSQAEHDRLASAVLVTDCAELAEKVNTEVERQLCLLPREEIARTSINNNGKIIVTESLDKAIEAANAIAPEHLELAIANPFECLGKIKNAGSVFLGHYCPEVLGDYYSGANHTLPTGGTARFSSALSVDDFIKKIQYTYYTEEALEAVHKDIAEFAVNEGLQAHANSALIRFKQK